MTIIGSAELTIITSKIAEISADSLWLSGNKGLVALTSPMYINCKQRNYSIQIYFNYSTGIFPLCL